MLRVAICHQNQNFIAALGELVHQAMPDGNAVIFTSSDADRILGSFFAHTAVDILIIDIELALQKGRELTEWLEKRMPQCVAVLTSKDGLVSADLLKIMPYRCLYETAVSAKNAIAMKEVIQYALLMQRQIYVWGYVKKAAFKISPDDIIYVSIAKHGSVLHLNPSTKQGKISAEMKNSAKLSELFEVMNGYGFVYAHNSYFINLRYVVRHAGSEIEMEDGNILSISRSKGKNFNNAFSAYQRSCFG